MRRMGALLLAAALLLGTVPAAAAEQEWTDSGLLWLVNTEHTADRAYVPAQLVTEAGGQYLRPEALAAYEAMWADLSQAGHKVFLRSGYRTYGTQSYLFQSRIQEQQGQGLSYQRAYTATAWYTAPPGASEHQLGLALDLTTGGPLTAAFARTGAGRWAAEHCTRYGFILRYTQEKSSLTKIGDEPWHFRYVGVPHGEVMAANNWCLEEYIAWLREHGGLTWAGEEGRYYEVTWSSEVPPYDPEAIDTSGDNLGGYIVTAYRQAAPPPPPPSPAWWDEGSQQGLRPRQREDMGLLRYHMEETEQGETE